MKNSNLSNNDSFNRFVLKNLRKKLDTKKKKDEKVEGVSTYLTKIKEIRVIESGMRMQSIAETMGLSSLQIDNYRAFIKKSLQNTNLLWGHFIDMAV